MNCPRCKSIGRRVKNGLNGSGSQKYKCKECGVVYTPEPKENGYSAETRLLAIRMYVEGSSYGSIARVLKVNPQSVANWVNQYISKLPPAPMPNKVRKAELDELYTFIGEKKRNLCSHDSRSRHSLCAELGCCAAQNDRSVASLFGARSPKPSSITVTLFQDTTVYIMVLLMKCEMTNRKFTRWKPSMQIYVII